VTAFPLESETRWLLSAVTSVRSHVPAGLVDWIALVHQGVAETNERYPFMAYGTDWLAFAHLVIAVAFWGPLKDPVRNIWVVQFGMIACLAVIPLAMICGPLRGIPVWWRMIDISFGVFGIVPLLFAYKSIKTVAAASSAG
jgi:hypothetical protein